MNDEDRRVMRDVLMYVGLIVAFILLVLYLRVYFDLLEFTYSIESVIPKLIFALITLFIVNLFLRISLPVIKKTVSRYFRAGEWKVIRTIYIYFIWFIALIIIVSGIFGNLSSLGISLSLIGAGIALALQQVILSFAAWFLIVMKRPYKIGDRIYIKGKDILGDVEDITMLFTVLKEVTGSETIRERTS